MFRRIFFWSLVLAFFIITPTLIGYALGYRYNTDHGVFVYAGSITISANPERVSIDINSVPAEERTLNFLNGSYHINGLRPGEHTLRVHREGFQDWKKNLSVQSAVSTEFWNVLLPKTDYPVTSYPQTDNAMRFFPAPKNTLFAIAQQSPENPFSLRVSVLNTANNETREVYASNTMRLASDPLLNIEWSPREDILLVPVEEKNAENNTMDSSTSTSSVRYLLAFLNPNEEPRTLRSILPEGFFPEQARWSPEERNTVYFLHQHSLWKIRIDSNAPTPELVASDVLGYDFYMNSIVVMRGENHILYRYGLDTDDEPLQITTTSLSQNNTDRHRIITYDDRKIAIINSQKDLFIHNTFEGKTTTERIALNIAGAQFSDDGKKLLFWNDREIFVYYMQNWDAQPQHSVGTLIQIARLFASANNIQWNKDFAHVIFRQGRDIKILELDARGGQNGFVLKTLSTDTSEVLVSPYDNKIFFTDREGEGVQQFHSIDFPENTGFFGL